MTRSEFQQLAEVRLREAEALLAAGFWDGAYYLAGYAVECGLKACIAKGVKAEVFPDKGFAHRCFTHDLEALIDLAGLEGVRNGQRILAPVFDANWTIVDDWSEGSRYRLTTEQTAQKMVSAIADPVYGVLQWIRLYW
jgi:HEPN domain-containing protein